MRWNVLPWRGYLLSCRILDTRVKTEELDARVPITAKVFANMNQYGSREIINYWFTRDQIQGFFDIPVDNIYATPLFLADIHKQNYDDVIVVSPDVGGSPRESAG